MYFAHAPKLVLTGSFPAIRPMADRAAALDAEVVLLGVADAVDVGDVAGFDVAVVAVDDEGDAAVEALDRAADLITGGLRRGALIVVASAAPLEAEGHRFAEGLSCRSGLAAGRDFQVVGVECRRPSTPGGEPGAEVTWSLDPEGAEHARYLLTRIGAPLLGRALAG